MSAPRVSDEELAYWLGDTTLDRRALALAHDLRQSRDQTIELQQALREYMKQTTAFLCSLPDLNISLAVAVPWKRAEDAARNALENVEITAEGRRVYRNPGAAAQALLNPKS
jgi:hypothetical protein